MSQLLYSGKAKSIYATDDPAQVLLEFRDDATAFNGVKAEQFADKGKVNNHFNAHIMTVLAEAGVATHFVKRVDDTHSIVRHLDMLPVECVVRNVAAGGLAKRLGLEEGTPLTPAVFEFFLKDDALNDPMINESHIATFQWATQEEIDIMKKMTFAVNDVLKPLFDNAGLLLVDYKLEFGRCDGRLVLGDEFTPDGCRIWDKKTHEKFDKDRFRRDLGGLIEYYREAAKRLGIEVD